MKEPILKINEKIAHSLIALPLPKTIGKVLEPIVRSPSISAMSFTISLIRVSPKAKKEGTIRGLIFLNTDPAYIKERPNMKATMILPIRG
jgi:hypothetical protein